MPDSQIAGTRAESHPLSLLTLTSPLPLPLPLAPPPRPSSPPLIDIRQALAAGTLARTLYTLVADPLERLLEVPTVNRLYEKSLRAPEESDYFSVVLDTLDVDYRLADDDRAQLPATGPLVVVANHPFGALDGVILGDILRRRRPDMRLLGNRLLQTVPRLAPWIIPVDAFGGEGARAANVTGLRAALRWLRQGGALAVFPGGAVSHLHVGQREVADPPWSPHLAALVRRTGATVVPVFFDGRNSALFQLAGLVHARLRTALLPRELLRRSRSTVDVRIGHPIGPAKIARHADDRTLTEYLRFKTYMLRERESPIRPRFLPAGARVNAAAKAQPRALPAVVAPAPRETLVKEVAALEAGGGLLSRQNDFAVYVADAAQARGLLREIGRLREETFRAVGEGTGRELDLDRFDDSYQHLFLWDHGAREVVGSYRIGRVDDILAEQGIDGLYTHTLFKFRPGFLQALGPSLELGRSFIQARYQRKPTALALIWRGIGAYLVQNPRYKVLWGPVSISADYRPLSRDLMVDVLSDTKSDGRLSPLVEARHPPRLAGTAKVLRAARHLVRDEEDLADLVADIEGGGRGMPILLRHYLKLNARLLGFNVDPHFGSCLDGLITVDLRTSEPKLLKRFMGEAGYATFMAAR